MSLKNHTMKLGHISVGSDCPPLIVAEMSGNHNQSLDRALELVDAAAGTGVHALKIQTYTPDTMTLNLSRGDFSIRDQKSLWNGKSLYALYQEAHTPWDWHRTIFDRCLKHGMIPFSTPFDETAVDFLESLNAPFYKIASFELIDIPLIQKVASTGKPMIMSTGMASVSEIEDAVKAARSAGCKDLILLKCTSTYPATPQNTHILTIPHMKDLFQCEVGLSDHTMGIGVSVAAVTLGAVLVEKHFTLKRSDGGVDSAFSLEPHEMKSLVVETERAWQSLGRVHYGPTEKEKSSLQFRRSLYIVADIKAGDIITKENVRAIRPGFGLAPKFYGEVIGKRVVKNLEMGTPLTWDLIEFSQ